MTVSSKKAKLFLKVVKVIMSNTNLNIPKNTNPKHKSDEMIIVTAGCSGTHCMLLY